jgi:hypothetical protein
MYRIAYPGTNSSALNMPADVVNPFLYLCSTESAGLTGQQLSCRELLDS